jgi:ABC-type Zn uptake system ZnuABC Zn-binding protein ZnuA
VKAEARLQLAAVTVALVAFVLVAVVGCNGAAPSASTSGEAGSGVGASTTTSGVLATTTYLADIVRNVAGDRVPVVSLLPMGSDPHAFEPRPRDARAIAASRLVVTDTLGLSPVVDALVKATVQPGTTVLQAATGLAGRKMQQGDEQGGEIDPHFWLDPLNVITYVANIRDALIGLDPRDAATFRQNADTYSGRLRDLDTWIRTEVSAIPAARRLLVTNHETFGYFAERYGFTIVGTVFRTLGAEGTPSAKQLAQLVTAVRTAKAPAIFLETGSNADLADEVARETGAKVVTDLYTHSLGKNAPDYIEMMRWNVRLIVEALR